MVENAIMPAEMKNWGRYEQIFDKCNIGPDVDPKVPGWFADFTAMADAPEIPFLNVRNSSIAGETNTNITSMDKIPWWMDLMSIGIRFIFPDPAVNVGSEHLGITTMAKQFCALLPEHATFKFMIKSYTFIDMLAAHIPAGFGPQGHFEMGVGTNTGFTSLIGNSVNEMPNRWKFLDQIRLPIDTPIRAKLILDDFAKDMLRAWDDVPGLDFGGEEPFSNVVQIELTLRGITYEQRVGEFRQ